ncbi:MAG TPA: HlyD family efflux transporter periplasmic adaptor subunit [Candidatus Sulfotelmatobacter sp.]|nr:HlyD family efflux transporter periplasmic adaptor subunit [Candidatus Sulfotelmatobacter sp.]
MDIPRQVKRRPRTLIWGSVAAVLALMTFGMTQLKPAAPTLERNTVLIDTVHRGEMVRDVRATGSLVPEDQRLVSALTAGRVERVLVRPGAQVQPTTLLLEMSNPDVQLEALDAERQLKLAEADLAGQKASLESQRLAEESAVASVKLEVRDAERDVKVAERLSSEGLNSEMDVEKARDRADDARTRYQAEQRRLDVLSQSLDAQLDLRKSEVERLEAIARFQNQRVASMEVRAGAAGVLQELSLQPGAWVNPGQLMARVAGQDRLKAVVQVPEIQARDLTLGLKAVIDTHNGTVNGHVSRVDPSVQSGTVAVDLAIDGELPRGSRPDLSVEAVIEIERLENVLYVGRPADGSSEATVPLYRLEPDGHLAVRVPVKLGRGSANNVEVVQGLNEGDQVILSEMSRWANNDRVRVR